MSNMLADNTVWLELPRLTCCQITLYDWSLHVQHSVRLHCMIEAYMPNMLSDYTVWLEHSGLTCRQIILHD